MFSFDVCMLKYFLFIFLLRFFSLQDIVEVRVPAFENISSYTKIYVWYLQYISVNMYRNELRCFAHN